MLQLVYTSKAQRSFGAGDFEGLLELGRERNRRTGVTSLLIYDGQYFLQAIEGADGEVERCFARIALDSRHNELEVIFLRGIIARAFGSWDLQLHRLDSAQNISAVTAIKAITKRLPDPEMAKYIRRFCRIGRRAA